MKKNRGRESRGELALTLMVAALVATATATAGCEEKRNALPEGYYSPRFATIEVLPNEKVDPPAHLVTPLLGMNGSPKAVVPGDPDLILKYWGRLSGAAECDGAHMAMVRLDANTLCDLRLGSIFPDLSKDAANPKFYDFEALDAHVKASADLNTAAVMWQAAYRPGTGGACPGGADASIDPVTGSEDVAKWATVITNTIRHLRNDTDFDINAKNYKQASYVEFMDDPIASMGLPASGDLSAYGPLFDAYAELATAMKAAFEDNDKGPVVRVGGMSWSFTGDDLLKANKESDQWELREHPVFHFIDYCHDNGVPLDFLTFRTSTATPWEAYRIALSLREALDDYDEYELTWDDDSERYVGTRLIATAFDIDADAIDATTLSILDEPERGSALLGAFQTAARIFFQDVPVSYALAGRGIRAYTDLQAHAGESPASLQSILRGTDYLDYDFECTPRCAGRECGYDRCGGTCGACQAGWVCTGSGKCTPDGPGVSAQCDPGAWNVRTTPAFQAMMPFRQVKGHQRVQVVKGSDDAGMAVVASHSSESDQVLHLIIANANVGGEAVGAPSTGRSDITYEIKIPGFYPNALKKDGAPVTSYVEWKLAVLDRSSYWLDSFYFSETGDTPVTWGDGDLTIVHEMGLPSVHYLQLIKPTP